jgi:lambda family phage portal protein
MELGRALDAFIGVFAPGWGLNRTAARSAMYASATTPRTSKDWQAVNTNANTLIGNSFQLTTARVDKLIRDFPYLTGLQETITDYVVGEGIHFNSRIINEETRKVDNRSKVQRQQIEDALSWWSEEASLDGRMQFWELQRMSRHRMTAAGEYAFIIHHVNRPGKYLPFALQPVETTSLSENEVVSPIGNPVYRGIEYDKNTGATVAYWFNDDQLDPTGLSVFKRFDAVRVVAEDVIFDFDNKRPGQLRGISPLASSVLLARDFEDVFNSEVDAAKMTSKYIGEFKTADPAEFRKRMDMDRNASTGLYGTDIQNAIMRIMKPGEEYKLDAPTRPSNLLLPFTSAILRMFAVTARFPYELAAADFTGMNYTVTRSSRAHHEKMLRPLSKKQVTHFNQPVIRRVISEAVLNGKLSLPGFFINPRRYYRGLFQLPGLEPVDPFRQSKADAQDMANFTKSPQEITARRGVEWESVVEQWDAARAIMEEHGFDSDEYIAFIAESSSTASQSNGNASNRELQEDDNALALLDAKAV